MWLLLLPTHQPRAWGCHSDTEFMSSAVVSDRPLRQVCWALHAVDPDHSGRWGDLSPGALGSRAALAVLADAPQVRVPSPKHLPLVPACLRSRQGSFCSVTS